MSCAWSDLLVHTYHDTSCPVLYVISVHLHLELLRERKAFYPPSRLGLPWSVPGGSEGLRLGQEQVGTASPYAVDGVSSEEMRFKLLRCGR